MTKHSRMPKLTTLNHNCDVAGLKYVYPVISRRTGGLSIGINFNTNNSCNWRCIYCQVPNLKLGAAPEIDLQLLEYELMTFLQYVMHSDFYTDFGVEEKNRIIKDIAIAGNGEPTSLKIFPDAIELIGKVSKEAGILDKSDYILITNGSLIHQSRVQQGLRILTQFDGEVWFKLDSATQQGKQFINNSAQNIELTLNNLSTSSQLCRTKIQTCLVDYDNQGLLKSERNALLAFFKVIREKTNIQQIMLYTLARDSQQPEAAKLGKLSATVMADFANEIKMLGYMVSVTV
jgi:wyosine [tRNA(Phe)-imidazoG37] synthetase (radical SAM superfamily)